MHTFADLVVAYHDCRYTKRNSRSAILFEQNLEHNLRTLHEALLDGSYRPGRTYCFVITHPKPREVWAAQFRDRVVHHLLYNHVAPAITARFIADSCACIPGRGTLYAARRLEAKARSLTENWQHPGHYLKCDLANFFVSIDKTILADLLRQHIADPWWQQLALQTLMHDPRTDYEPRGPRALFDLVPPHKRLTHQPAHRGLPIGNLSSQFFANIYLNELDQHIKHTQRVRHYVRYVDDMILLARDAAPLNEALASINAFLPARLNIALNSRKTILQPIARGIDFAGLVIKPWHTTVRRHTLNTALQRIHSTPADALQASANSYLGLLRQASTSHTDRARLCRALRLRGRSVNFALTKSFGA